MGTTMNGDYCTYLRWNFCVLFWGIKAAKCFSSKCYIDVVYDEILMKFAQDMLAIVSVANLASANSK